MPKQGEVVDAPFRANRRLMFVMRRFLYIAQSIQMLAFCIIRFAVGYILPDWASWMIWFGFGGQTIATRKYFSEWMAPNRPRDHRHFTTNPNSW